MEETITPQPTADSEVLNTERSIVIDGSEYETNIPNGVQLIAEEGFPGYIAEKQLLPGDFDALDPGAYVIRGEQKVQGEFGGSEITPVERTITIREGAAGKVISRDSLKQKWPFWSMQSDATELMQSLGYEVEQTAHGPELSAVPTPETVRAAAGLSGVDIRFFSDVEHISGSDYLQTFADGQYPVSTKTETMYWHDIDDDHLTAMVLGGEPLKQSLSEVAKEALAKGGDAIDGIAARVDTFTATLRGVISAHQQIAGEAYGLEMGRSTLIRQGEELGIKPEETQKILEQAQARARALHMNVKQLL